jgi:FAD-linked oxidoreductase
MQNWSKLHHWQPAEVCFPVREEEIVEIVRRAATEKKKIRLIGSGHSFTPLCVTDNYLISLDKYQGLISVDKDNRLATVKAGTKINTLNLLLDAHGLALENMGDIDVQSIAGAISTGTHGTGSELGNVSTQVQSLKFVDGRGDVRVCSRNEDPELFRAAAISLGSLGIITEVTLKCELSYNLAIQVRKRKLSELMEEYPALNRKNRHFEYYWFPNTDYAMTKELTITDEPAQKNSMGDYLQELVLENYTFLALNEVVRLFPSRTRATSRLAASTISDFRRVRSSFQVFSTARIVRFNEMEYNIPIEAYEDVNREIVNWINKHNYDVLFPLEHRFVKGDDLMLSPAYKRDAAYIAAHVYHKKDHRKYFRALEDIFRAHEGRPHWGKLHTLSAEDLHASYPEMDTFLRLREACDPDNIFLSPYLESLFINPATKPA